MSIYHENFWIFFANNFLEYYCSERHKHFKNKYLWLYVQLRQSYLCLTISIDKIYKATVPKHWITEIGRTLKRKESIWWESQLSQVFTCKHFPNFHARRWCPNSKQFFFWTESKRQVTIMAVIFREGPWAGERLTVGG